MIRSLYTAATGMKANQLYVDNISNNLANVNTTAYKKSKMEFEDLLYQTLVEPGSGNAEGARNPAGLQVGLGVKAISSQKIFTQGNLTQTENPLDVTIQGNGFFQIMMPDGKVAYSRDGSFQVAADGNLVTSQGYLVEPPVVIPEGTQQISIDDRGRVMVVLENSEVSEEVGQLETAQFINTAGLLSLGNNLFASTPASGEAEPGIPGERGLGLLKSGYLETSNVQLVEEMVSMIVAQRAYEISSKAIQTSEEMLQLANNLRR